MLAIAWTERHRIVDNHWVFNRIVVEHRPADRLCIRFSLARTNRERYDLLKDASPELTADAFCLMLCWGTERDIVTFMCFSPLLPMPASAGRGDYKYAFQQLAFEGSRGMCLCEYLVLLMRKPSVTIAQALLRIRNYDAYPRVMRAFKHIITPVNAASVLVTAFQRQHVLAVRLLLEAGWRVTLLRRHIHTFHQEDVVRMVRLALTREGIRNPLPEYASDEMTARTWRDVGELLAVDDWKRERPMTTDSLIRIALESNARWKWTHTIVSDGVSFEVVEGQL